MPKTNLKIININPQLNKAPPITIRPPPLKKPKQSITNSTTTKKSSEYLINHFLPKKLNKNNDTVTLCKNSI